jgi:hypothetical protein
MVVTLCSDEVGVSAGDAPCTSLPQLTPEGLPLALARRAADATRMDKAIADLEERGDTSLIEGGGVSSSRRIISKVA